MQFFTSPEGPKPVAELQFVEHLKETPEFPLINGLMIGQDRHEAIIRKHLAENYNVHVELGTELKSFVQTEDYVEAVLVKHGVDSREIEETVRMEFLVGTDGARSTVRKQLGLAFLGKSHQEFGMVVGDLHIKSGIPDRDYWRVWGDMNKASVWLRPLETDDDRYNFLMGGQEIDLEKAAGDREALYRQISTVIGREIEFGDLIWSSLWRANVRMVTNFGTGRVFIGGDAAHVHSPTGAQGMNSGVQDSINLAWKIALVHHRHSPLSLLDSYSDERLPVIAAMLNKTTDLMNRTFRPILQADNNGVDTTGFTRGFELRQLGVNYRGSSVIIDEKHLDTARDSVVDPYRGGLDGTTKAGYRAPAAPGLGREDGSTTTLFDLFSPSKHTVLVFADESGLASDLLFSVKTVFPERTSQTVVVYPRSYSGLKVDSLIADYTVVDTEGYAFKHYNVRQSDSEDKYRVFVIRPDGYIGGIVEGEQGLKQYGKLVFG
ncbi:hypothetical protein L218DRAFT_938684 [Marasmius fiardii PR-910]|nr:hypothetical protein L218DRAFT_938684 [Marasmius fiardii PR-910]